MSCFFGEAVYCRTTRDDDIHVETHQFGRKVGKPLCFALRISPVNNDVFPFHVAKLAQTLPERLHAVRYNCRRENLGILSGGTFFVCCASAGKQSAKSTALSTRSKALTTTALL